MKEYFDVILSGCVSYILVNSHGLSGSKDRSFLRGAFEGRSFESRWAVALLLLLAVWLGSADKLTAQEVTFDSDEIEIVTQSGERHGFTVEVAKSSEQMAQGLMYRQEIAPNAGMIFLHKRSKIAAMWMKNTLISLDMLFIDSKGKIQKIAKRTVPLSEQTIASNRRVLAVLELKGGTADRLGLAVGDRVEHPAFQNR